MDAEWTHFTRHGRSEKHVMNAKRIHKGCTVNMSMENLTEMQVDILRMNRKYAEDKYEHVMLDMSMA